MSDCCGLADQFDRRVAARDLERYRRLGPIRSTRRLLEALREAQVRPRSVLDVGGGVGAVQAALASEGAERITSVDASPAYAEAAQELAEERGFAERVERRTGRFPEAAAGVGPADLVVLDRVVCCDPDWRRLVSASVALSADAWAAVYPRARWSVRAVISVQNRIRKLRGSDFRVYVHHPERIEEALRAHGFTCRARARTFVWHVAVFRRDGSPPARRGLDHRADGPDPPPRRSPSSSPPTSP